MKKIFGILTLIILLISCKNDFKYPLGKYQREDGLTVEIKEFDDGSFEGKIIDVGSVGNFNLGQIKIRVDNNSLYRKNAEELVYYPASYNCWDTDEAGNKVYGFEKYALKYYPKEEKFLMLNGDADGDPDVYTKIKDKDE